jgi:hypothetical protein
MEPREKLRLAREIAIPKITRPQLAEWLGLHWAVVTNLENGRQTKHLNRAISIMATKTGIPESWFYNGLNDRPAAGGAVERTIHAPAWRWSPEAHYVQLGAGIPLPLSLIPEQAGSPFVVVNGEPSAQSPRIRLTDQLWMAPAIDPIPGCFCAITGSQEKTLRLAVMVSSPFGTAFTTANGQPMPDADQASILGVCFAIFRQTAIGMNLEWRHGLPILAFDEGDQAALRVAEPRAAYRPN